MATKVNPKEKLTFVERLALKKYLKNYNKKMAKLKELIITEKKDRIMMEEEIWKYRDVFEMTTDDGQQITRNTLKEMTIHELTETFEDLISEIAERSGIPEHEYK